MYLLSDRSNYLTEKIHTGILIGYFSVLGILSMVYTHPLWIMGLWGITLFFMASMGGLKKWLNLVPFMVGMTIFIVVINGLVSRNGQTLLFVGPTIPLWGKFTVSLEALYFGMVMALKLSLIISLFCLYEITVSVDRAYNLFVKFIPKSALVMVMTALLIPRMKTRFGEIKTVMTLRGASFNDKRLKHRIRSYGPLLKTLLLSSLEDAWQMAETLSVRAFGVGKRTSFIKEGWTFLDSCCLALMGFIVTIAMQTILTGKGFISFYPKCESLFNVDDLVSLSYLLVLLTLFPLANFLWQLKNNYLKFSN